MDVPDGHRHRGGRGSTHRTSFIEYVSEVYNSTRAAGNRGDNDRGSIVASTALQQDDSNPRTAAHNRSMVEALSIRGHSISSVGSGASGGGLSRDFSVRSEMGSNRVLGGGRHHPARGNKTSRVIGKIFYLKPTISTRKFIFTVDFDVI